MLIVSVKESKSPVSIAPRFTGVFSFNPNTILKIKKVPVMGTLIPTHKCKKGTDRQVSLKWELVRNGAGNVRYYGLDALRAAAIALGIVLHAALPYFNTFELWPSDDGESLPV